MRPQQITASQITDEVKRRVELNKELEAYNQRKLQEFHTADFNAATLIIQICEPSARDRVIHIKGSYEMWNELAKYFGRQGY